jgi:hypothetical protein
VFWTGFLRVGSQLSLLLAPLASILLILGWLAQPFEADRVSALAAAPASATDGRDPPRHASVIIEHR